MIRALTWHTGPHVGAQVLSVGAGAGVFGRVFGDLRSLEAQVLAASVSHAAQVTAVRPFKRRDVRRHQLPVMVPASLAAHEAEKKKHQKDTALYCPPT